MMPQIHFFHIISIAVLSVLMFGVQSCQNSTPADTPQENSQPKKEQPKKDITQENTSYTISTTIDSTKVQIVDTKRFIDEVCKIEHGKYGFQTNVPIIIDFYADWCKPCCTIAPYLVDFAKKYAGQILIYKVNVDKCADVAAAFDVESIPTLIFYKPGSQPVRQVGASSKSELEKMIQELLLS